MGLWEGSKSISAGILPVVLLYAESRSCFEPGTNVSLLKVRHTEVLRLLYFEGYSQEGCAKKMDVATRTVRRIKDDAINELAEMYSFTERAAKKTCPEPVQ